MRSKCKNGSVKIFNYFTVFDNEAKNQKHGSIHITNCEFQDESSSIFYITGASGIMTVVNSCVFKGTLKKSDRIIEGIMSSKDAPKLFVVSCIFENELENFIIGLARECEHFYTRKKLFRFILEQIF